MEVQKFGAGDVQRQREGCRQKHVFGFKNDGNGDDNDDDIEPEQHGYGGVKWMQTKGGWTDLVLNFHLK